ncbi:hypothetical protein FGG08_003653 [Glutinoglossum americanum]|uniref:Uncharacterized protein n=1 Tax=Glutinoglossum americanum TaxID=1670608 RepID=A0A9P8I3Y0_9PEZI|nr:hypothetical protein FGG08_003653 [Glutinoglossum americanum]
MKPHWGRPPGARTRREWMESRNLGQERFEELDSGDDDGETMALVTGFGRGGFVSDEFKFAGADIGPRPHDGKGFAYEDYYESEDGEASGEEENHYAMSMALRNDELAQMAEDRILHAQLKGNPNVDLSHSELDALGRRNRVGLTGIRTRERSQSSSYSSDRRRRRPAASPQAATQERTRRRRPAQFEENNSPYASSAIPPGFVISGPSGTGTYTPIGYYTPSAPQTPSPTPSRHSSRRTSLSYAQQGHTPPSPQYQHQYQQNRYFSTPEGVPLATRTPSSAPRTPPTRSPLPHEADWVPRSRSGSSAHSPQPPYPVDPFQYQTYSPPLPAGGQPAVQYAQYGSLRRAPGVGPYPGAPVASVPASPSSPPLLVPQPTDSTSNGGVSGENGGGRGVEGNSMPGQWKGSDVSERDWEPRRGRK